MKKFVQHVFVFDEILLVHAATALQSTVRYICKTLPSLEETMMTVSPMHPSSNAMRRAGDSLDITHEPLDDPRMQRFIVQKRWIVATIKVSINDDLFHVLSL